MEIWFRGTASREVGMIKPAFTSREYWKLPYISTVVSSTHASPVYLGLIHKHCLQTPLTPPQHNVRTHPVSWVKKEKSPKNIHHLGGIHVPYFLSIQRDVKTIFRNLLTIVPPTISEWVCTIVLSHIGEEGDSPFRLALSAGGHEPPPPQALQNPTFKHKKMNRTPLPFSHI